MGWSSHVAVAVGASGSVEHISRTHRLSNLPPPTLPGQKIVQESASPDHRHGGIAEKLHVGQEAAKVI